MKANVLQFQLSSWLKRVVASTVKRGKNQVIAPAPNERTHLSILPWQCSLFIIIIKTTSQTYEKKNTLLSLNM